MFETVERSFLNHALDGVIYNIKTLKTTLGFNTLYDAFHEEIDPLFRFGEKPEDFYYKKRDWEDYLVLKNGSKVDWLIREANQIRDERNEAWRNHGKDRVRHAEELDGIRSSTTYRIGAALVWPARFVRDHLKGSEWLR